MTTHRRDDPDDLDAGALRNNGVLGDWFRLAPVRSVGLVGVVVLLLYLVLYLVGALPWSSSPLLGHVMGEPKQAQLDAHIKTTETLLRVMRQTCRGTWQHNSEAQKGCDD